MLHRTNWQVKFFHSVENFLDLQRLRDRDPENNAWNLASSPVIVKLEAVGFAAGEAKKIADTCAKGAVDLEDVRQIYSKREYPS